MDEPITQNPYKTLGVPKDATLATIRSAHRKLVLSCHPDKVQEESAKQRASEQFHLVQQAYEVLSDDHRRQRYDEKTKLAELRAEMMDERIPLRRAATYASPRAEAYAPNIEVRGNRVYEERVPKSSYAYQEDVFAQQFAESRPAARKFEEVYVEPRSSRRSSGRAQEEKIKAREAETERERRARDAKKEKMAFAERARERTRDKRRDADAKFRKMQYMEDDISDSDMGDTYYVNKRERERETAPPKRRFEEVRKKDRDESKRSSKKDASGRSYEDDVYEKEREARDYISRSRETMSEVYVDPPRSRPSRPRGESHMERVSPTERMPPAPPPAPPRPAEAQRRSSERERSDKERSGGEKDRRRGGRNSRQVSPVRVSSGKKDKRYEIVDPPSSKKPSMPTHASDPKGLKGLFSSSSSRKEPQRSATHQPASELKHPGMRRSETMPVNQMRRTEPVPLKSSTLRNTKAPSDISSSSDDSSSEDSDETPEVRPRMSHSQTKYKVQTDDVQSPRTVYMEPEEFVHRPRESSPPKTTRRASDRPSLGSRSSSKRTLPTRGASFAEVTDRPSTRRTESARMPPLSSQNSGRSKDYLFGAVDEDMSPLGGKYRVASSPKISSPKMSSADARYSSRKVSEDFDRDAYPGSMNRGHRRPSYARGESVY